MRRSLYFLPTLRETPTDAQVVSHQLMLRAGMIHQVSQGIYDWLPLGYRVLSRVEKIISEEQDRVGAQRILTPTIQPASLWQESGRYDDYGKEMLRIKDRHDRDLLYSPTAEEVVTALAKQFLKSYQQLPLILYQISWKFRDEIRPRFGVMRGREFLMEDTYSFDVNSASSVETYKKLVLSYLKTFERMGVRAIPIRADSGAIGGTLSHEFHIMAETGESQIYYDAAYDNITAKDLRFEDLERFYTAADERHRPEACPVPSERLISARGIEVGHVFSFGQKYSAHMGLALTNQDGQTFYPEMGSYGIGVSRLVAAIIEASHDDKGIIWPEAVAPFQVGIITTDSQDSDLLRKADELMTLLREHNVEALWDDRKERAGVKFADMDLIGLPHQIILGSKAKEGRFEWKTRKTNERQDLSWEELLHRLYALGAR